MSDNDIDAEALADRVADDVAGIWTGCAAMEPGSG
jgi:hypothetical protein